NRPCPLRVLEHAVQVLLGLADVLAHDLIEVDSVELSTELVGERRCCFRAGSAVGSHEQRCDPGAGWLLSCTEPDGAKELFVWLGLSVFRFHRLLHGFGRRGMAISPRSSPSA